MNYLKIDKEDVCNGEGLRVVLWLSGCSHRCKGCQNPQTWDANSGIPFDESAKEELFESNLDGVLDLVTEVNKRYNTVQDTAYVKDKNNNILTDFSHEIRLSSPQKSIWIYSGFVWENIFDKTLENIMDDGVPGLSLIEECERTIQMTNMRKKIISQCNILIDGRYIESQRDISLPYRGSSNQRLIDIQQSLQKGEIVLWQI